jgi:hypothetical protein
MERFPGEQIVRYNSRTGKTHVIFDPNKPKKLAVRVIKPEPAEESLLPVAAEPYIPFHVSDLERLFEKIDERFAALKREQVTAQPAALPPVVINNENPSLLSTVFSNLLQRNQAPTPAPSHSASDLRSVADALNNLAIRSTQAAPQQPAPNLNISMPAIHINAQMPAQDQAPITFAPNIQPSEIIVRETVPVNINVEPAAPAVNNISIEPAAAPINNITVQPAEVNIPKPVRELQKIQRGPKDLIESTETKIEY